MKTMDANPFDDPDRKALWEICVRRDIEAFLAQNWPLTAEDFQADGFVGIDGCFLANPDAWKLTFPTLDSYRAAWEQQSREFAREQFTESPRAVLYAAMRLDPIELRGDHALIHKKFTGELKTKAGNVVPLRWQSLFFARRVAGQWKLHGFVGYLPFPWPGAHG
jgi:hypothetical protein